MQFVQEFTHTSALQLSIFENGGTTTNISILLLYLRCPPFCNERSNNTLERQRDKITIHEQVFEEFIGLRYLHSGTVMV